MDRKILLRRVRKLVMNLDNIIHLFAGLDGKTILRTTTDLPDDARVVWVGVDNALARIDVYIESAQYDEVPEGVLAPEMRLGFTTFWPSRRLASLLEREWDGASAGPTILPAKEAS